MSIVHHAFMTMNSSVELSRMPLSWLGKFSKIPFLCTFEMQIYNFCINKSLKWVVWGSSPPRAILPKSEDIIA